jgi:aryl-alcohol dehydrogenase-like predicted oxidoreductase
MNWSAESIDDRRARLGRFILGTGNFGGIASTIGPGIGLSAAAGHDLIDTAMTEGLRVVDTSDVYARGASEKIIGSWAAAHHGADVIIQTKTGITEHGPDLSPHRIRKQLDSSIATLGRVDFYLAHTVDRRTPWSDSIQAFSEAVETGLIRAYGLSNVGAADLSTALETADNLGLVRPELVQNSYSLLHREDDTDLLPIVHDEGLTYMAYSPLANGVLSGRYSQGEKPDATSRAAIASPAAAYLNDKDTMVRVREFDRIAASWGVSPSGLALGWLVNHPIVTAPIVGISKASQWQGIHEALRLEWTENLGGELSELFHRG